MRLDAVWHMPNLGAPQLPLYTYLKNLEGIKEVDTVKQKIVDTFVPCRTSWSSTIETSLPQYLGLAIASLMATLNAS